MGIGDDIIATGMARGAKSRGRRIAFGDGRRIIWGPHSKMIFSNNPNIASPGLEGNKDIEWIRYHKGHRIYNKQATDRWVWNYDFKIVPGEIFFNEGEKRHPRPFVNFVLIEPNVPIKTAAPNKQWPIDRYQEVADHFVKRGQTVVQFDTGPHRLNGVKVLPKMNFREAMLVMTYARLAVLPEGGLHHAAAALGIPAVVLFGGFVPPAVLGYSDHINLTGNSTEACGKFTKCDHCLSAMNSITVEEVLDAAAKVIN